MKIQIEVNEEEFALFEIFAKSRWQSVPEMVKETAMEKIEDAHVIMAFEETLEAHRRNPFVFSLDEVKRELGIL